jgi:hypothetical protein
MQAARSFKTLATNYQPTRCHIPEDFIFYQQRREKLKSHIVHVLTFNA